MPDTRTITVNRRSVGFVDYGPPKAAAVVWCHGGPGSRMEPAAVAPAAAAAGLRIIGIDRPGYGASTPNPGRSIADWVPDGLAVVDAPGMPGATLNVVPELGHFSIVGAVLPTLQSLARSSATVGDRR